MARSEAKWFYFFISPWIIGYLIFTLGPIIFSGYLSFTRFNLSDPPVWVGLQNYRLLLQDSIFWKSLQVSAYYTFLSVPLGIVFSLLLALLLNQKVPFMGVFRTLFYLPSIMPAVASTLLFVWILNSQFGILNYALRSLVGSNGLIPLGLNGAKWLEDPKWVIPSFTIMSLWGVGGGMLIYLSGLQGIPTQLYEAATIDGAGRLQRFWHVTIPMISPVILFTFITGVIGSFQVFTQAWVVNGGSGAPAYSSMFYVLYLFVNAFRRYRMGTAAAQAWLLFIVILVLTILFLWASKRFVYYEDEGGGRF
ncbi:MAG TPA: sugar ABC transporter permease [Herpetosiphonaceae bacterium]|nr:sugar ABC transporter permease [Herpetosiphonaceae bacterium]